MVNFKDNDGKGEFNPFADLNAVRLDQSFTGAIGAKKVTISVGVHRPPKSEFIRTSDRDDCRIDAAIIKDRSTGQDEWYFIAPQVAGVISHECSAVTLLLAVTQRGEPFIWPIPLPGPDGRINEWWRTARIAAEMAMTTWVRVIPSGKSYVTFVAQGNLGEPKWPEESFPKLLKIAFKDRFVDSADHPLLRQLRGEAA
jgi:hypothetical protein